jgi:hypothetical protein
MPDLQITAPFSLLMDLKEVDDHLPSFQVSITLDISPFGDKLLYQSASTWFKCSDWDIFLSGISSFKVREVNMSPLVLTDLRESLKLVFSLKQDKVHMSISVNKEFANSSSLQLSSGWYLDLDEFELIKSKFNQFPKYW